ncbi:DNA-binding protein [Pseudomonas japonica]|uniref:Replication region DNA-binding N-term n=1 Tax=Pseudomonas japonica TaxID=256466 RepID=A0A239I474_9PSED|nr:DNA-binding protein [Pseudomonas japonica]SNS88319.1 replication region DNA-binding N-term [Pseudomonas japonica]
MPDTLRDEEIFAAADAVMASGRRVTPARVCHHLGRGALVHIGSLLDQWWPVVMKRLQTEALPASLYDALNTLWAHAMACAQQNAAETMRHERQVMEKAFAKQRRAFEQTLMTEQQEHRRLASANAHLQERLDELRVDEKAAKSALHGTEAQLQRALRLLAFERAGCRQARRRERHEYKLAMHTLWKELCPQSSSVMESTPDTSARPDSDGRTLWSDFTPLLAATQSTFERRLDELQGLLDSAQSRQSAESDKALHERCLGNLLVLQHLLDELQQQVGDHRTLVKELEARYLSMVLAANGWMKG